MREDSQETVADILAKMRKNYTGRPPIDRAETTHCRRLLADRIEAAVKREREKKSAEKECLERIIAVLQRGVRISDGQQFHVDGTSTTIISGMDAVQNLMEIGIIVNEYIKHKERESK